MNDKNIDLGKEETPIKKEKAEYVTYSTYKSMTV